MKKLILILPLLLTGCGVAARETAALDVIRSKANYKDCLAANDGSDTKCKNQKEAYLLDIRAYEAMKSGGFNNSVNVNNGK